MPTSFEIQSSSGRYAVDILPGSFDRLLRDDGSDRVFIADSFLQDRLALAGVNPILIVAGEEAKSLDRMSDLITQLRQRRVTRGTTLIAVGGGVVQDAAAFVASIYMRGLSWIYVPTTLLSMTDSCIGGKSSINVGPIKNIVGTIHPPKQVLIDPELAGTLSAEQVAAGLCEAAKICLCRGASDTAAYLALDPRADAPPATLSRVIELSLKAKKWFIEIDEFDQAERLILNFGHTFGHALETASHFTVGHGIAVGLGALAAIDMGGIDNSELDAFRAHIRTLLKTVNGLDIVLAKVNVAEVMGAFEADKKHKRDAYAVILPGLDGRIERQLLPRTPETLARIEHAVGTMLAEGQNLWRMAA